MAGRYPGWMHTKGGRDRARPGHVQAARALLGQLANRLRLGGIASGKERRVLPDGTTIEAAIHMGIPSVRIEPVGGEVGNVRRAKATLLIIGNGDTINSSRMVKFDLFEYEYTLTGITRTRDIFEVVESFATPGLYDPISITARPTNFRDPDPKFPDCVYIADYVDFGYIHKVALDEYAIQATHVSADTITELTQPLWFDPHRDRLVGSDINEHLVYFDPINLAFLGYTQNEAAGGQYLQAVKDFGRYWVLTGRLSSTDDVFLRVLDKDDNDAVVAETSLRGNYSGPRIVSDADLVANRYSGDAWILAQEQSVGSGSLRDTLLARYSIDIVDGVPVITTRPYVVAANNSSQRPRLSAVSPKGDVGAYISTDSFGFTDSLLGFDAETMENLPLEQRPGAFSSAPLMFSEEGSRLVRMSESTSSVWVDVFEARDGQFTRIHSSELSAHVPAAASACIVHSPL